jgi:hypothetical protein
VSSCSAVAASNCAEAAISWVEALVCCVDAETCSADAEDCSATAATSVTVRLEVLLDRRHAGRRRRRGVAVLGEAWGTS